MTWVLVPTLLGLPLGLLMFLRWRLGGAVKCFSQNRLDGKVVLITGASSGIGKATATECARRGAHVILACRDEAKTRQTMRNIETATNCHIKNLHYVHLDLNLLSSVRTFVGEIKKGRRIDILINNAGYLGPKRQTCEGKDQTFVVNYLGHFLLTLELLKHHEDSSNPIRVMNLTSDSYQMAKLDLANLECRDISDIYQIYGRSKLAMLLFTGELVSRYDRRRLLCVAVHPGAVRSGLQRHWPGPFGHVLRLGARLFFRTPLDGAQTTIYCCCASDDEFQGLNGKLLFDCAPMDIKHPQNNGEIGKQLWSKSVELCETCTHTQ